MKKDEITIGGTYLAKVTDKVVPVRLDQENPHGGWDATNLVTNKKVRIKSAQRLRGSVSTRESLKAQHKADQENARLRDERSASSTGMTASERAMEPSDADTKPRSTKKRVGMSCLDAAAKVLQEAGEPMNTKAMVEAMAEKGYWTSDAPTPWATLYSALLREVQKKGDDSRFAKAERGMFILTTSGKKED